MKYKDWLNEWLEYYVKPVNKETTYGKYRTNAEKHIIPVLGNYGLNDLYAVMLQKFVADLTKKQLSANTINGIIGVLKLSIKRAAALGEMEKNVAEGLSRPKVKERRVECFTTEEQRKIENYILNKKIGKRFGIVFCFYTGLRIGELAALKWTDLDLEKGLVTVTKSCRDGWKDGKYKKITDSPKTESSRRIIPVPKQLMPYPKELKRGSAEEYFLQGQGRIRSAGAIVSEDL